MQEFIASCRPSARSSTTVQAPQSPSAQPSLVPLSPRWSRSQSSRVVIGDTPAMLDRLVVEREANAVRHANRDAGCCVRRQPRDALDVPQRKDQEWTPTGSATPPSLERPKLSWPKGARVAVWVCPNIEHYEYLPAEVRVRNPWPRMPHPDVLGYGGRDYGNRVGLWRMFEVLDKHAIRCTVSLSMSVIEMYPEILEAMEARRWEYMSHGYFNTRYHWGYSPEEEREVIEHSKATHLRLTGRKLRGWFSPAVSNTLNTPDIVKEAGLDYFCDFYHDDQPTPLATKHGPLIHVPYTMDINDAMIYRQPVEAEEFAQMIVDHFDTVYREGAENGRVMCIALHPYMMGAPHRLKHLDRALAYIRKHKDAWICTAEEILDWYTENGLKAYQQHLGKEA